MQPIPQPISDVSVYPYVEAPIELSPVIEGATGTYSVGTQTTSIFYNMDLQGGNRKAKLERGGAYFAVATDAEGNQFRSHWMHCTDTGDAADFGLTQNMLYPDWATPALPPRDGQYVELEPLTDFTSTYHFKPPAIGSIELTLGGTGWLITTQTGTPHLDGFRIAAPKLPSFLTVGSRDISVSATAKNTGQVIVYEDLTLISATQKECVFLQQFP